jgi:hypothetical protein
VAKCGKKAISASKQLSRSTAWTKKVQNLVADLRRLADAIERDL